MLDNGLKELIDLAEAVEARLSKASALLTILRTTATSTISDEIMHEYVQTIYDLVEEARDRHTRMWERVPKAGTQ